MEPKRTTMKKIIRYIVVVGILTPISVLLLMVLADLVKPYKPPQVEVETSFKVYPETQDNWAETANAIGVHPDSLTIERFMAFDTINGHSYEAAQDQYTEHLANR
jgi:uncharacterized membrane protein